MKSKGVSFFVAIVIIVFVFAIAFFGVAVGIEISNGKNNSSDTFSAITEKTNHFINQLGFTDDFCATYAQELQSEKQIAAVVITKNADTVFAYPVSSPIILFNEDGKPVIASDSPFVRIFSANLDTQQETDLNLIAAVYLITPSAIFNFARITFFIILAATLLIFGVLFYYYKKYNKPNTEIAKNGEFPQTVTEQNATNPDFAQNSEKISEKQSVLPGENVNEDVIVPNENQNEADVPNENEKDVKYKKNFSDPQGLFSDKTGLGWEVYFETRLDSEIGRCASSQQDLSLFIIRIVDFPQSSPLTTKITDTLLSYFNFRDLIFEHGDDGYAAILQDKNLDDAMTLSQDLYTDLSAILINNDVKNKIVIGISTRSLRLVTGAKLIEEATQAANKAMEEEGLPIVAFRVDLKKYRETL